MARYNEICKAFNQQATEYEYAAKVQQEIGSRLFERLNYLTMKPQRILDLGCGPGVFTRQLARLYPKAQVIGLDFAHSMLIEAKKKYSWRHKWPLVTADMKQMPFASGIFDLVFTNQAIHWAQPQAHVFREINRVMNVNACFMFSTLGPDTFKEIRSSWSNANQYAHTNDFADMHDVGDALLAEHFLDPVMDMELLAVHYGSLLQLVHALKKQGVRNVNPARNHGLTGKASWQQFEKNYAALRTEEGKYPLTYEVVYGHAWKGEQRTIERGIETVIPIAQILNRKK